MIDALLLCLAAGIGGWSCLLAWSPWRLLLAIGSVGLLLGALIFRRVGLAVSSSALAAALFITAILSAEVSRLWQALGFGVALFVLLEVSWDRVRMLDTRFPPRSYARRLAWIARCAALSAVVLFVSVTLGYNTVGRTSLPVPFVAVVAAVGLSVAGAAALVFRRLRERARAAQEDR